MGNGIIKNLKIVYESIKETLFPSEGSCFSCKDESDNSISLCSECIKKLSFSSTINKLELKDKNILIAHSVSFYSSVIKEMILRLKYKGNFEAGEVLAFLMFKKFLQIDVSVDFITYVPMFKKDENKRGFNQSKYLAKEISRESNIEIKDFLVKIRPTKDQIGLSGEERKQNLKDCFQVINKETLNGKRILLIDDVLTTGATVVECANVLKKANCSEIIVLTVAKSAI